MERPHRFRAAPKRFGEWEDGKINLPKERKLDDKSNVSISGLHRQES